MMTTLKCGMFIFQHVSYRTYSAQKMWLAAYQICQL